MATTIYRTKSGSLITPYRKGSCKALEKATGIFDPVYHRINPVTGFCISDDEGSYFACGTMSKSYIEHLFPAATIRETSVSPSQSIGQSFGLTDDVNPTELQLDTLDQLWASRSGRGEWFINLQTGYGKTLVSVVAISMFQKKTMVFCYSTKILQEWIQTIRDTTTFDLSRLLLLDSSKLLDRLLSGSLDPKDYDVYLATPQLLMSYQKKRGWKSIPEVMEALGIGMMIFDEADRHVGSIVRINAFTHIRYTLYLSAEFAQAGREKEELYRRLFYGVPIYTPTVEQMEPLKYIQALVIHYRTNPSIEEELMVKGKWGFSPFAYMRYEFSKPDLLEHLDRTIQTILDTMKKKGRDRTILVFVNLIEHANSLYEHLEETFCDQRRVAPFHGELSEEEQRIAKEEANLIVATYQSTGRGLNIPEVGYVITINQNNKVEDNQSAGRMRPPKDKKELCYYIMMVDDGFSYAKKKLRYRIEYLAQTKIKSFTHIHYD